MNVTLTAAIANASIAVDVGDANHIRNQGNGWELSVASYQGNYGRNYGRRACIAINGYQQLTTSQTLYPGYQSAGFTRSFSLPVNISLLNTFSRKPPVFQYGFWSLTVYGSDQCLVPNSVDRLEVDDRSYNLTYLNSAEFVCGPEAEASADGSFQVLVQPAHLIPPAKWIRNWLSTSQNFSFISNSTFRITGIVTI